MQKRCSWDRSFRSFPFGEQTPADVLCVNARMHLCDMQVTHPFLTNAFILTSIDFGGSCKMNMTSGDRCWAESDNQSKNQLEQIPGSLPAKGEPLPNDMISLNPRSVPQPVESTRVFHSAVMTTLFADEREQGSVKPATHRLVWVIRSWETERRRRTMRSQTDDRRLWIFFSLPGLFSKINFKWYILTDKLVRV